MHRLKVWNCDRSKKYAVMFAIGDNVLNNVLQKGSQKLQIRGEKLVAEDDGTMVEDEDDIMHYSTSEKPLLLLEESEMWYPANLEVIHTVTSDDLVQRTNIQNPPIDVSSEIEEAEKNSEGNKKTEALSTLNDESANNEEIANGVNSAGEAIAAFLEAKRASFTSWATYTVPFTQIQATDLEKLRRGMADDDTRTSVVHTVVSDMRFYNRPIYVQDWRRVSAQLMIAFPETFEDRNDDGSRLDSGYNEICRKLQEHNNYLNRSPKRPNLVANLNIKLKHRRTLQAVQGGTIQWQPEDIPPGETEDTVIEKRDILKEFDWTQVNDVNPGSDIELLLKATYAKSRSFLNDIVQPPTINKIVSLWPCLLKPVCLFWHFKELTGVSLEKLCSKFEDKMQKILLYGQHKLHLKYKENLTDAEKHHKLLEVLQTHFKENETNLLLQCHEKVKENFLVDVTYPCILYRSTSDDDAEINENENILNTKETQRNLANKEKKYEYFLIFEGQMVFQAENFVHALKLLIAIYFVFNKTYPKNFGCTLQFLQMYFLNISPPDTICRARNKTCKNKALTLNKALKKIIPNDFNKI